MARRSGGLATGCPTDIVTERVHLWGQPTGIFYAGGVKANVLFFDKKPARPDQPWTTTLWVYDFRGDQHFTLKQNRMQRQHLDDSVACYRPAEPRENREPTERFRPFTYEELTARDKVNLDITLVRDSSLDDAASLLPPDVIAREIVKDLEAALSEFAAIAEALQRKKPIADGTTDWPKGPLSLLRPRGGRGTGAAPGGARSGGLAALACCSSRLRSAVSA